MSMIRQGLNITGKVIRSMSGLTRHRFSEKLECALNKQINMELEASYIYLSMAFHYDRADVALKGMYNYFKKASDEERDHAMKFMTYLNKRGGKLVLDNINKPENSEWDNLEKTMTYALDLEKKVTDSLLEMHALASSENDADLADFLDSEMIKEQYEAIKEIGELITNIRRCGNGLGEFMFDKSMDDGTK
ncbi:soma ferritin [Condylostylus longicornis]|uniref:soma ferritin n=1 Tax=Condylostylus longicornis TaxID=2530218 RepID=UPI00244E2B61|nr:soma ferritin [Condylostylus longicornis]